MVGQTISHYKVFEKVGEGGMASLIRSNGTPRAFDLPPQGYGARRFRVLPSVG